MKIAVASTQCPFIRGGAEIMAQELITALRDAGHVAELITMPFRFGPISSVRTNMDAWEIEDWKYLEVDRVICLKFPTFYLRHDCKVTWLMHQHRSVYELFDTPYGEASSTPGASRLRQEIIRRDTAALKTIRRNFTISARVSERLKKFNDIDSIPLHQPPAEPDLFFASEQMDYIFFPSRVETLKRQELLIRAMQYCNAPVAAILAGEGGSLLELRQLATTLGLQDRVRFLGRISLEEMRVWFANSLGVFFGPFDEDYGFVTLEAMLSSKPVITCHDSGGPLEFVIDGVTGLVTDPTPESVGSAIQRLHQNKRLALEMGRAGRARYESLNISWHNIVDRLID